MTFSCDVATLQCESFSVEAFSDVATLSADVALLLRLCSDVATLPFSVVV